MLEMLKDRFFGIKFLFGDDKNFKFKFWTSKMKEDDWLDKPKEIKKND